MADDSSYQLPRDLHTGGPVPPLDIPPGSAEELDLFEFARRTMPTGEDIAAAQERARDQR